MRLNSSGTLIRVQITINQIRGCFIGSPDYARVQAPDIELAKSCLSTFSTFHIPPYSTNHPFDCLASRENSAPTFCVGARTTPRGLQLARMPGAQPHASQLSTHASRALEGRRCHLVFSHSRWQSTLTTVRFCGTHPTMLERERTWDHQLGGP